MATKINEADFVAAWVDLGSAAKVAKRLGITERAVHDRAARLRAKGYELTCADPRSPNRGATTAAKQANATVEPAAKLADPEVKALRAQLAAMKGNELDAEYVKRKIIGLSCAPIEPPDWLVRRGFDGKVLGVPTLFASDWHWAEVVDPQQINGVNEYNLAIAHRRARRMIEKTVMLLRDCFAGAQYPGIVFALGGDMVSGDIHDELAVSNEVDIMPCVIDLIGVLAWCIRALADEFGQVFVPCVSGNHGRNTPKIRAKGRNHTSFDWLAYCMLAREFANDPRVHFLIPDGPDAYYRVYGTRYLLTHGDQFRGGDGMIGALGPIIRGDHKKRSRAGQVDMAYDVLLLGHWHQLIQLQRLIVNGSLKGYDEYAYSNNFGFERARQALWITHPEHGITFSMAVNVDDDSERGGSAASEWVSLQKAA
ncbi:hypothetical protein HA052_20795 [Chromobacterium haemolyticum]|uniref:Uncharacterized protein n=1 Tax=Chromobacterium fluminis TaxID=3044269 RepID=A0ABX0L7D9_9NEIS|nr:hypothetical protein [Chromobacterium haemolyticum]NHR07630.1 hypothetical protein [Chromobacterium haemolyticum]